MTIVDNKLSKLVSFLNNKPKEKFKVDCVLIDFAKIAQIKQEEEGSSSWAKRELSDEERKACFREKLSCKCKKYTVHFTRKFKYVEIEKEEQKIRVYREGLHLGKMQDLAELMPREGDDWVVAKLLDWGIATKKKW